MQNSTTWTENKTGRTVVRRVRVLLVVGLLWINLTALILGNDRNNQRFLERANIWATSATPPSKKLLFEGEEGFPMLQDVPLLPFEIQSAINRTCNPPPGMPMQCCLGSASQTGKYLFRKDSCRVGMVSEMLVSIMVATSI